MALKSMDIALPNQPACLVREKRPKVRIFNVRCSSSGPSQAPTVGLAERPWKTSDARLVLEDGSIWRAKSFGASDDVDTRAVTRRLRRDGSLVGVLSTDESKTVEELLGKVLVYGICMGHQLLGQVSGGRTFKMNFGHHGRNHPGRNL